MQPTEKAILRLSLRHHYYRNHHNALYTPPGISRRSRVVQATETAARATREGQRIVTAAAVTVLPAAAAVAAAAGLTSGRRLPRSPHLSLQESFQGRVHPSSAHQQHPPLLCVYFCPSRILHDRPCQLARAAVVSPGSLGSIMSCWCTCPSFIYPG